MHQGDSSCRYAEGHERRLQRSVLTLCVQTQFWDASPSTGPSDSWTIHGLWPDHCDGTYDANCDASRAYTNISSILSAAGQTDLLSYMNTYWKDSGGNDESFWEHEWGKHGTCISTLEPSCYTDYTPQEEVVDFFSKTVSLFKTLPSYTWLSNAGIVPSTSATYTSAAILAALQSPRGVSVAIQCENTNELDEIWYFYDVAGSVQTGTFIPTDPGKFPTKTYPLPSHTSNQLHRRLQIRLPRHRRQIPPQIRLRRRHHPHNNRTRHLPHR